MDSETTYYRITTLGRTALTAKDDTDALMKAKSYDQKWGGETVRIVRSVNTVIWRKPE